MCEHHNASKLAGAKVAFKSMIEPTTSGLTDGSISSRISSHSRSGKNGYNLRADAGPEPVLRKRLGRDAGLGAGKVSAWLFSMSSTRSSFPEDQSCTALTQLRSI